MLRPQKEDSYDVVVGHANVIRYFVCKALQAAATALDYLIILWLYFITLHIYIYISKQRLLHFVCKALQAAATVLYC